MLSYSLKCKKNTESKNPRDVKAKNKRIMFLSNCAVCGSKKSRFAKAHEASGTIVSLSNALSKITLERLIFNMSIKFMK